MRIVVVGAGLAGLCAGYRLKARHDVTVLECEAVPGGKIRSERIGEFLFDWGPNGFSSADEQLCALVAELGIEGALTPANPAARKRFVYWNGGLRALPVGPLGIATMSLLSAAGKLRALREFMVRAPADRAEDEDIYGFFARRFGTQVAQRVVAPALLGISGGDAGATSVDAIFPKLRRFEREHGSVLRGFARRGKSRPGRLTTFGAGMQQLTDALAAALGDRLALGCEVSKIERSESGWRAAHRDGTIDADALVIATPADVAASLLSDCDRELGDLLRGIDSAPMRVVGVAYAQTDVPPLDGFGFLVAREQGVRILGALYTSTLFPGQAPKDSAYLRVFLGGAVDRQALDLDRDALRAVVRTDLAATLGISAEPIAWHEHVWTRAIPQYGLGHGAKLARIAEQLQSLPGLDLVGNAYRGLGVADVVADAFGVEGRLAKASRN